MLFRLTAPFILLALFVAACSAPTPPDPFRLNGLWGGVMNHAGTDFAVFALDVSTTSGGVVSGYGLLRSSTADVYVNVTGVTRPAQINLTLTDLYNDTLAVSGSVEGDVIRGDWTYASHSLGGSFRMAPEENIHLLDTRQAAGRLADLFMAQ